MGAGTPGVSGTSGRPVAPPAPLGRRLRALLVALAVLSGLTLVGVAVWAVADPGHYSHSGDGCITLTVAGATGGSVVHACGDQARVTCRNAFAADDRIARLTRPECVAAGLGPGQ